ncbi:MAG: hypothetical protein V4538_08685 [Bacteroidota bacterium]
MLPSASLAEIKRELQTLDHAQLLEACLRLAKFKKDNKELLNYLLFELHDENKYIEKTKALMSELFTEINTRNIYFAKKSIRKILKIANKYGKYSVNPQTSLELLIHFCTEVKSLKINYRSSTALSNLYDAQLKKIHKIIGSLHEDLQYDYSQLVANL